MCKKSGLRASLYPGNGISMMPQPITYRLYMHCLRTLGFIPVLFFPFCLAAQSNLIHFVNASFEDLPKSGEAPVGWYDCGKVTESPPDIQPGFFSVSKPASHGDTYLGLVARDNDTWEAVAQRLSRPLKANNCYEMTIDLCRSEIYISLSRTTGQQTNYTRPLKLIIWGGYGFCDKREVLWESADITHHRWLPANIRLAPKKGDYTHLIFEAYYIQPNLFAYNGNILVDNVSPIKELDCNFKMPPFASNAPTKTPVSTTTPTVKKPTGTSTSRSGTSVTKAPPTTRIVVNSAVIPEKSIKKGDIIRIEKLYFEADQSDIKPEVEEALENILAFLKTNPKVVVEVGGHTNNRAEEQFALELSTKRAKSVADWLISNGVSSNRVQYKGYGWKMPIASNESTEGRVKNQRVEVKILSTDG